MYAMDEDGANARIVTDTLHLRGAPAWSPDSDYLVSAAEDGGVVHLFRIPLDGGIPRTFVQDYSVDPNWAPDGSYIIYSGPDIGTNFRLKAANADASPRLLADVVLTRGTRHVAFLPAGHELVFLRGELQHKNLWALDVRTGAERQLSEVAPDFDIRDFDISADGHEFLLERLQENSNVVLIERSQP